MHGLYFFGFVGLGIGLVIRSFAFDRRCGRWCFRQVRYRTPEGATVVRHVRAYCALQENHTGTHADRWGFNLPVQENLPSYKEEGFA